MSPRALRAGFSLVDVIVGVALMLVLFLALFGILRASLTLSALTKAQAAAIELANTQLEYLRGLSYDALGTVGGIPAGTVPETSVTTKSGISYTTHTFVAYVDDPADGSGTDDSNGITTDYKRARITVSYSVAGQEKSAVLVSNFAPPNIESSSGGGTLVIVVVDALGAPVAGATAHITNPSLSPSVDVTTFTDSAGEVSLLGAATSTDYRVTLSKDGFSSTRTYARDATNANPNPGPLTVVKDQTTAQTFAIDQLSTVILSAQTPDATTTVPLSGAAFTLTGSKTIGSESDGTPIYKTTATGTTGNDGTKTLSLEWDSYALTLSGHDIKDACPTSPYAIEPGETFAASLLLVDSTTNNLRVLVTDNVGTVVAGAQVTLSRTGYSETAASTSCGSAYFGGVDAAGDYTVSIAKTGYSSQNFTNVSVSGATVYNASFP